MADLCDKCWYNAYDEESDEYFCDLQLDEDECKNAFRRQIKIVQIF